MTGKNVLLLPMGSGDDGAHSQNEKIEVRNYIEGVSIIITVLLMAYNKIKNQLILKNFIFIFK